MKLVERLKSIKAYFTKFQKSLADNSLATDNVYLVRLTHGQE